MTVRYVTHKESAAVLLFGGLVGAGVALMTVPWSGKETRRRIGDFAEDVKERAKCYTDLAKGKGTSAVEKGKKFIREKKWIITTAVEAGTEAYKKERERLARKH